MALKTMARIALAAPSLPDRNRGTGASGAGRLQSPPS